jgi:hypothetical protein
MRISKFSTAICAVVVCASFISVRADDTPAQAAARAALEQKMQELDAQQAATNAGISSSIVAAHSSVTQEQPGQPAAPPPPVIVVTPSGASLDTNAVPTAEMIQRSMMPLPGENQPAKSVPTPAPVETAVAPVQTPAPVVTAPVQVVVAMPPAENPPATISADTEAQARALQALHQKMSELDKQQAETSPPAVAEIQPAPAAPVQAPVVATPPPAENAVAIPAPTVPVVVAAPTTKLAAPETKPVVVTTPEQPASVNYPGKELGLKPIEAPSLPISADKQARLQALLAKYKADQITPEEYFKQREAILAEP